MVEDILYNNAKIWFSEHTTGVVDINYYTGPIGSAIATGYIGIAEDGAIVAIVSTDALARLNGAATKAAMRDMVDGTIHRGSMTLDSEAGWASRVTPLLVVSYRDRFTKEQYDAMAATWNRLLDEAGWRMCIVAGMDEAKVQAFGLPMQGGSMDGIDNIIEALIRLRDAGPDECSADGQGVA